jgi:hypothetical protein
MYSNDPASPQPPAALTPVRPGGTQPVNCPYCRRPLTTRADLSFTCGRCGDFPNYGRMFTAGVR